jgi:hypothetical protein
MEIIGSLFMTMVGGGGAAAAGGLSALQTAGSIFGAVATIGSGLAANSAAKAQAREHEFQARDEYIEGKETSAALKAELARTIGNQAVAFAGGGVNLGSVSVEQAKTQATRDAENELGNATDGALSRSLAQRRAAANARARGRGALVSSLFQAGGGLFDTQLDIKRRGNNG